MSYSYPLYKSYKFLLTATSDDDAEMMVYPKINEKLPAYAVIINNQNFHDRTKNRSGSEKDVQILKQLDKLNISFEHTLTDLTADEMVGALTFLANKNPEVPDMGTGIGALKLLNLSEEDIKELKNTDEIKGILRINRKSLKSFNNYSCLMVFILTHGSDDGALVGIDSKPTTVENLSKIFYSEQCKELESKPKIFVIQACRGKQTDVQTDQIGDKDHDDQKLKHDQTDSEFAYTQIHNHVVLYANFDDLIHYL